MLRVRMSRLLGLSILLIFLILIPLLGDEYIVHLAILAGIGAILAMGLNVFLGHCGQINFGPAGFWSIGAYTVCLLQVRLGFPFWLALLGTIVISFMVTLAVSVPLLRLRGHTLALGTLAFGLMVYHILETWVSLTGGGDGISVPAVLIFGHKCGSSFYYVAVVTSVIMCYLTVRQLTSSRVGRAMRAIREDEVASAASGINPMKYRYTAFILNGVFCGLAGALYAPHSGLLAPSMFNIWASVAILVAVIVGGLASDAGALVGGVIIWLMPELLSGFREYHMLIYGLILFLVVRFMPQGLVVFIQQSAFKYAGLLAEARQLGSRARNMPPS